MGDDNIQDGKYKPLLRQAFVTANVVMTVVGNGCSLGITAILIPGLRDPESSIHATIQEESWIASAIAVPLVIGNILVGVLLDVLGRKKCLLVSVIPISLGWFITLSNSIGGIIAGRLLQGVALGIFLPLCPIVIGEMTEPKYRGMFLSCISLSLTIGILLSHGLGSIFSWQMTTLICSFTTFTSLVMVLYAPESPSWLISKGKYEDAKEIFIYLRGNGEEQVKEFDRMVTAHKINTISVDQDQGLSLNMKIRRFLKYFNETRRKPEFYKPIIISILMFGLSSFAGTYVMSAFALDIIKQVVGPNPNVKLFMVVLDIERLICNILVVYLIKVLKRRMLLFTTGAACLVTYFGQAAYVFLREHDMLLYDSQWIPMSLIVLYMFTLTIGISALPPALAGELFPLEYRGLGSGISNVVFSLNFFLAVKCFPVLCSAIGIAFTYFLYGGVVTVSMCVIWFMLPETKDRTLQDIEDEFRGYTPEDIKTLEPLTRNDVEKDSNNQLVK